MINTHHIVTLLSAPGVGRKTVLQVLQSSSQFTPSRVDELRELLIELKTQNPKTRVPTDVELKAAYDSAEATLEKAEELSIKVLALTSPNFPPQLSNIPDPPVVLYAKGNIDCLLARSAVAVIGTRDPSTWGEGAAERIGAILGNKRMVVVSGLAIGCDTGAHQGCIKAGGQTVAVLAHGLDKIYPSQNRELADSILDFDGCLVSEYPPGVSPRGNMFIERDRLQSGLSAAVIVIETDIKGGTMHTVRFCLEQERLLGCLAHPPKFIDHPKAKGNQKLIAEGRAVPLASKQNIEAFIARFFEPPAPQLKSDAEIQIQRVYYKHQLSFFDTYED
jgi:DNA processing protein